MIVHDELEDIFMHLLKVKDNVPHRSELEDAIEDALTAIVNAIDAEEEYLGR